MADIREGLQGVDEPDRSIGFLLIEFYESMKALERDDHRGGKQATAITQKKTCCPMLRGCFISLVLRSVKPPG
jgi:hypothetical protein